MTALKLGRKKSPHDDRDLRIAAYLAAVPAAPAHVDWSDHAKSYPMFLTDAIGDCAVAAQAHQIQAWTSKTKAIRASLTNSEILKRYELVSGYEPGLESSDVGANECNVLKAWLKDPFADPS